VEKEEALGADRHADVPVHRRDRRERVRGGTVATPKAAAAAFWVIPFAIASVSAKRPAGPSLALA
jgi:hypothetical protein